jgi:chromate transporter
MADNSPMPNSSLAPPPRRASVGDLARLFLKIGTVAFGGPPAHIAMMEEEVVGRHRWLTREQFLDFLGASNLLPGPTSTELSIYIGWVQRGWLGLLVAGWAFILPSTIFVLALAWAYVRYGSLPQVAGVLYGIKPVVIAIIVQAVWKLAQTALKSTWLALLGALAMLAFALRTDELLVLALGGLLAGIFYGIHTGKKVRPVVSALIGSGGLWAGLAAGAPFSLGMLFLVFLKIGAVLFGGGYVLIALIRANLVAKLGWITERQLLDAIAMGQVTPGPLSTTATFIGYLLGGWPGAVIATLGMFLPSFFFIAISGPLVPRIRKSPLAGAVLDGVNVAALALIAVVTWQLFRAAVIDWTTAGLAAFSFLLLIRYRVNSLWLVLGGAAMGLATIWAHF